MSLIVNRRDLDFVLFELLDVDRILQQPLFAAYDRDAIGHILDTAQQIAEDQFQPVAAETDANEPAFVDGKVVMPDSTAIALRTHAENVFFALPFAEEVGGLQAPWFLHMAASGIFTCANTAVTNYAFLTIAAANLINAFASDELKQRFLPPMLEGRWFGTMCLSEPQAGSSLADIRTIATPAENGHSGNGVYKITGSKMWISGGEHEITENIAHMVLAKIPGGPAGTKGISLFLVPKRRVGEDGQTGELNNIALAGLNHKMGQRGTTNCLLNFGEDGDCLGYLIGEPHQGIRYMFHMMNEARISVGHASAMAALGGYLYSSDYAQNRPQGRHADNRDPASPQVPIIEHADVKRMLLAQKAAAEGAQALCLYSACLIDDLATASDAAEKEWLSALLGLLTPVVKSWPSEHCLEANKWAIQVLGGYGYTREYPVERYYRDNRLNHIHEGTFGIQGMDLLGRKVLGDEGATLRRFVEQMRMEAQAAASIPGLSEEQQRFAECLDALMHTTGTLLKCDDRAQRLANAAIYLDAFGHIVIGWIWLKQAIVAAQALQNGTPAGTEATFYNGKLATCRYFFRHELPLAKARLELCNSLDNTSTEAPVEMFYG